MTEPMRLANVLTGRTDQSAAGLLVAIHTAYIAEPDDAAAVFQLKRLGLIGSDGHCTPLGAQVAMVLRARGIVPAPGASA